ncbi:MAG: YggS family pyridoxal phosphate-dependent enzyme [Porticoccaceae bacterium]|jgi:pyridoxal phosphate enzyme (YggS family)|nr:YggS family pyridoxal phosphate-dependent enzyme [Porticoccaceae bacterium]
MPNIEKNITSVERRLQQAAREADRNPDDILLLAVSKTQTSAQVRLAIDAGLGSFGENYLEEAIRKIEQLKGRSINWHFIGSLQSNKTKQAAENFSWVHTVDRLKIAKRLSDQRPTQLGPLNICLQINIDDEPSKSGFSPQEALEAAVSIATMPNLRLRGLMAIPKPSASKAEQRQPFAQLRALQDQINGMLDNSQKLDTLSMGMSGDLEPAIHEGATIVRVGTDIFGPRH